MKYKDKQDWLYYAKTPLQSPYFDLAEGYSSLPVIKGQGFLSFLPFTTYPRITNNSNT